MVVTRSMTTTIIDEIVVNHLCLCDTFTAKNARYFNLILRKLLVLNINFLKIRK